MHDIQNVNPIVIGRDNGKMRIMDNQNNYNYIAENHTN
jgi:hypothetical protein